MGPVQGCELLRKDLITGLSVVSLSWRGGGHSKAEVTATLDVLEMMHGGEVPMLMSLWVGGV